MKKLTLLALMALTSFALKAQDLTATHSKIPVTDIVADAWTATLNDDMSFYKDTFSDFAKQEFGIKSKSNGKTELVVEKASITRVSDKRGDLRVLFITEGSDTKLAFCFLLGYDIWINPEEYGEGMEQLRQLTRDYLRFHYTEYYNDIIEKDLKVIEGHKKNIDKNEKSIANMRKQITKNEGKLQEETNGRRIASMEKKNQQNREDIDRLTAEIPGLRDKITALDDHIQQVKTTMKNVEAQYYDDSGALTIPESQEPSEQEYVEDPIDSMDELDDDEGLEDDDEGNGGN